MSKSAELDEIFLYFLRVAAKVISFLLTHLISLMYTFGVFPKKLQKSYRYLSLVVKSKKQLSANIFVKYFQSSKLEKSIIFDLLNFL